MRPDLVLERAATDIEEPGEGAVGEGAAGEATLGYRLAPDKRNAGFGRHEKRTLVLEQILSQHCETHSRRRGDLMATIYRDPC